MDPFTLTPPIIRSLQTIECIREKIRLTTLPPLVAERLHVQAHIRSTHLSTRIDGNRLSLEETRDVLLRGLVIPEREQDVHEVENYYQALQQIETWVLNEVPVTEDHLRRIHAILNTGQQSRATPCRGGQNEIRDEKESMVGLPSEAPDIPVLMSELIAWIQTSWQELPIPVIAGLAHSQLVAIHPFDVGNGRTARALTTWILLYRGQHDLGKIAVLEDFYVDDLRGYYNALNTHPQHNRCFGHNTGDLTTWLDYFLDGMVRVFEQAAEEVTRSATEGSEPDGVRDLLRSQTGIL